MGKNEDTLSKIEPIGFDEKCNAMKSDEPPKSLEEPKGLLAKMARLFRYIGIGYWASYASRRSIGSLVAYLPDSSWHFLRQNARRMEDLKRRASAFDSRLFAFKRAAQSLCRVPDEFAAAVEQLARERAEIVPESDAFLAELKILHDNDANRHECLWQFDRLIELEDTLHANDGGKYRQTRDLSTLRAAIALRENLETERERLGLPESFVPARAKKLVPVG